MKGVLLIVFIILTFNCCKKENINYIDDDTGTLPRIEITIDDYYLWSADSGLYVIGSNGISLGWEIANYNQKWEFPANIKYIEHGEIIVDEEVGLRIKGNHSRSLCMKPFGFYWRDKYGNNKLEYPIFKNLNIDSYKRLLLRNSGNDFGKTQIHDISMVSIVRDYVNFESQEYTQCVVYLNDAYWGIYNLREMITTHYFESHFGFPKENIDLLEGSELTPIADNGNIDNYINNVIGFIDNNDLSLHDNYNHIKSIIDIDSYIDYIIVNTYICNKDWPHNNMKWWKDRTTDNSKWRWIMYDTDLSFQLDQVETIWIGDLIGEPFSHAKGSFYIFNKLIENIEFQEIFLNRYLYIIENVFDKHRVESLIQNNKNRISEEYDNFHDKWEGINNKAQWEKSINNLIEFNNQRYDIMKKTIEYLINENN